MGDFFDSIWEIISSPQGVAALLGGAGGASGLLDGDMKSVGYQGAIPRYKAVQHRVPHADLRPGHAERDLRRPGSQGRRYFTDTFYGELPENGGAPLTIEQARDRAQQQLGTIPAQGFANGGGIASLAPDMNFLNGPSDGMADQVPANIDGQEEARLSDGEFVLPADVVSHLGNGNSAAGANKLYSMMEKVRQARTGQAQQAPQIDPSRYLP